MIKKALRTLFILAVLCSAAGSAGAIGVTFENDASPGLTGNSFDVVPFSTSRFYLSVDGLGGLVDLPSIPLGSQLALDIDFSVSLPTSLPGPDQRFYVRLAPFDSSATPLYPAEPATTISGGLDCGQLGTSCNFGYSVFLDGPYDPPSLVPPVRLMAFDVVHDASGAVRDSADFVVGVTRVSVVVFPPGDDVLPIQSEVFPSGVQSTLTVTAIPEPSTAWLSVAGLLAVVTLSARRRTRPTAPAVS